MAVTATDLNGRGLVCGIDIGGTFTDCVVVGRDGTLELAKTETIAEDPTRSIMASLVTVAGRMETTLASLVSSLGYVALGSTIGTNVVAQRAGARTGVLTTRGFEDTLLIMRGNIGRTAGRRAEDVVRPQLLHKPPPIVEPENILGIDERTTSTGETLLTVSDEQISTAVDTLLSRGMGALAICFLWSCRNPDNELRAAEIARRRSTSLFVTCSSDVSQQLGEYERFTSAVVNAMIGPATASLLEETEKRLREQGYRGQVLYLNCSGGVLPATMAAAEPILLLGSGPAGGVAASSVLADKRGEPNLILCDMGGTTFDVGVIVERLPLLARESVIDQYSFYLPRIDITSIGAGGGSIAFVERRRGAPVIRVGPESAGSYPGPVAYGRGGRQPTVTDADLVLGYLDAGPSPAYGRTLDRSAAVDALIELGKPFGWTAVQAAHAVIDIIDAQSASLISQMTVERGLDPRTFAIHAYGGGAPLHVGRIARLLGLDRVVVPLGPASAVWSAYGAATADVVRVINESLNFRSPWQAGMVNSVLVRVRKRAEDFLQRCLPSGQEEAQIHLYASLNYVGQIHSLELPLAPHLNADGMLVDEEPDRLLQVFFNWYDNRYGNGFAYRARQVQLREIRCALIVPNPRSALLGHPPVESSERPQPRQRAVWWPGENDPVETPVFPYNSVDRSQRIEGPALIETFNSTLVVHPGQAVSHELDGSLLLSEVRRTTR